MGLLHRLKGLFYTPAKYEYEENNKYNPKTPKEDFSSPLISNEREEDNKYNLKTPKEDFSPPLIDEEWEGKNKDENNNSRNLESRVGLLGKRWKKMEANTLEYHKAKDIINKGINDYMSQFEGVQLPELNINKKGEKTEVKFSLSENTDLYNIMEIFAEKIGKMEIGRRVLQDLSLEYDNTSISFDSKYGKGVSFSKKSNLTSQEVDALIEAYISGNKVEQKSSPAQRLEELGVRVYESNDGLDWDTIAGYEGVKQEISDTVLLPLSHPEIYERIAQGTRQKYETIKPKAVLFEGPPGTGKTTTARIIAGEAGSPLAYVPIESIMTKWYGESERNLSYIFEACREMGNSLLFLDELDSLGISREGNIHEASRRVLSVLLRKIDGFEPNDNTILIGATNRKEDLDAALLSRFDVSVNFPLPNKEERESIFSNYAKQLEKSDLEKLAKEATELSGRNIKDICEQAERRWASKILRNKASEELPPLDEYLQSLASRKKNGI